MKQHFQILILFLSLGFIACNKDSNVTNTVVNNGDTTNNGGVLKLSYGDSILYLTSSGNNIYAPKPMNKQGKYYGFPSGIELDSLNGNINLLESETGLRYKIMFVPDGSTDTISTKVVLSGINFYDGIYNLSNGDSVAKPIYNANGQFYSPGQFNTGNDNMFDDGNGCNNEGCAVSNINGSINLAQSLRNGAISSTHDAQKEFTYYYRVDDKSNKTLNRLKVKLYYYQSKANIPQYLWNILLNDHAGTILKSANTQRVAKPRPPCIVVVAN